MENVMASSAEQLVIAAKVIVLPLDLICIRILPVLIEVLDTEHCSMIKLWNHGSLATELQKRKWRVFNILFFLQETNESRQAFILPVHERLASQILKWVTKQPGCNLNLSTHSPSLHTHTSSELEFVNLVIFLGQF